jgi:hypothetical protein
MTRRECFRLRPTLHGAGASPSRIPPVGGKFDRSMRPHQVPAPEARLSLFAPFLSLSNPNPSLERYFSPEFTSIPI